MSGNTKRTLFVAAVMVMAAVTMTAGFAGSAAAAPPDESSVAANPADTGSNNAAVTVILSGDDLDNGDIDPLDFSGSTDDTDELVFNVTFEGAAGGSVDASSVTADDLALEVFSNDGGTTDSSTAIGSGGSFGDVTATDVGGDHIVQFSTEISGAAVDTDDEIRLVVGDQGNAGVDFSTSGNVDVNVSVDQDANNVGSAFESQADATRTLELPGPVEVTNSASFHSVASASDAAGSGETITVTETVSEYATQPQAVDSDTNDDFELNEIAPAQGVTLDANSGADIIFDSDTTDSGGNNAIEVGNDGVTIQNLNISGNGFSDDTLQGDPIAVTGQAGVTIQDSQVVDYTPASNTHVDLSVTSGDLTVSNVTLPDVGADTGIEVDANGIGGGNVVDIINNTIELDGGSGNGIVVEQSDDGESEINIESTDSNPIVGSGNGATGIELADSSTIADPITISGLNITNLGTGAAISTTNNNNNINARVTIQDSDFDVVGDVIDAPDFNDEVSVSNLFINNSQPQNNLIEIDTGSVETSSVTGIDIDNLDATDLGNNPVLSFDFASIEDSDVDNISAETIANTASTDEILEITNAGSSANSDELDVTNIDVTDAQNAGVLEIAASNIRFTTIDAVTADNTTDVIDVGGSEDSRSTVFVNISNVDANETGRAVDITNLAGADDTDFVNIDAVTASNLNDIGIVINDNNVDELNITNTEISESDADGDDGIQISNVAGDATVGITADILNVSTTGIDLSSNLGTVDITDSTIEEATDGIGVNSVGSGAQVNVTNVDFNTFSGDGIAVADGGFGDGSNSFVRVNDSSFEANQGNSITISNVDNDGANGVAFVNATDTQFLNSSAIEVDNAADGNGDELTLGLADNWWADATGPNVDSDSTGDRFARGNIVNLADAADANDIRNIVVTPWYDSSALNAFAFGIEGQVTEPDGSTGFAPQDVTISYQGQTSDIDDSTTFNVSASGEYVAVIDEHDGSEFYTASANTQGFAASDAQEDITISGTTFFASQDFTLNDGAALEGFVNNASGEQLQSTGNLQLIDASNDEVLVDGFSTNASGGFTVSLTPDTYDLRVNHPNFDSSNTVEGVELQSGNTTTLATNFTLREDTTADLTATVEFSNGTAIENTDVTFSGSGGVPSSNDASLPVTQTTNSSGIVQFEIPASDTNDAYTITADSANFSNASTGVAPAPGDSVSRTFSLEADQQQLPTATVTFGDEDGLTVQNGSTSVDVASARFDGTEDFVIVVHRASPGDDGVVDGPSEIGDKIGSSDVLSGNVSDVSVNLTKNLDEGGNTQLTENQTLIAMLHFANESRPGDRNFDMPIVRSGSPVFDQAEITIAPESPLEGPAGEFDVDGDGDIGITELGRAGTAFTGGEITLNELTQVAIEFTS